MKFGDSERVRSVRRRVCDGSGRVVPRMPGVGFSARRFGWVPLILLVLGVVVMHHVPAHSAGHRAPSTAHTAIGSGSLDQSTAALGSPEHQTTAALGSPEHRLGVPAMPAHDPLHLCLAILAGLTMLLLPLLGTVIRPVQVVAGSAAVPVRGRPRAPPSVPRRLALLCVLRR